MYPQREGGAPGFETDYFGPATKAALQRFQCAVLKRCAGTAAGVLDAVTINALNIPASVPVAAAPALSKSSLVRQLGPGIRGQDVKNLQKFLNAHGFIVATTGPGSPGNETMIYGDATARAISAFQEQYRAEILTPFGLTKGTGFVGDKTLKKLNELMSK